MVGHIGEPYEISNPHDVTQAYQEFRNYRMEKPESTSNDNQIHNVKAVNYCTPSGTFFNLVGPPAAHSANFDEKVHKPQS